MKTFRSILYATDFSDSSLPAADYALSMAKLAGAKLIVLHVIGELADPRRSQIQSEAYCLLERELEVQAIREMEAFCSKHFGDAVKFESEVVIGAPFQEILKRISRGDIDLVVLGTHGRTGIEHVIVGSTAERLVRRSKVPVLTVRGEG
jgi:nucleotide-binding universal stress UspA family protein